MLLSPNGFIGLGGNIALYGLLGCYGYIVGNIDGPNPGIAEPNLPRKLLKLERFNL